MTERVTIDLSGSGKRACGSCQLCCKLLPVRALDKGANTRCQHQRVNKGCMIYDSDAMPVECRVWSCRWLVDKEATIQRPDRTHYVVDIMPDMIGVVQDGQQHEVMVIQVWVDPAFPDAHRDPALRAYLAKLGERDRTPSIVRNGNDSAILLIPPAMTERGGWIEQQIGLSGKEQNRFVNMLAGREV